MSGHSKWNNIKRKKEKTDGARAKVFTKIGREISVAVRDGGPNPASNSKLADLIAKAKRMSVPNDNIQRIIKKAEGGDKTEFEAITYEGYGPGGVAVMVETLTDNRNRTAADLRHYFDKNGGNLGAMGCVGFLFSQKGVIDISLEDKDADEAMMDALDAESSRSTDQSSDQSREKGDDQCSIKRIHNIFILKKLKIPFPGEAVPFRSSFCIVKRKNHQSDNGSV